MKRPALLSCLLNFFFLASLAIAALGEGRIKYVCNVKPFFICVRYFTIRV